jgi:hypothetical protein
MTFRSWHSFSKEYEVILTLEIPIKIDNLSTKFFWLDRFFLNAYHSMELVELHLAHSFLELAQL